MQFHESPSPARWRSRLTQMLSIAAGMLVLITLVRWGGTARPGPLYVFGVALLLGLILSFTALAWWLYFSPLPDPFVSVRPVSPTARQVVVILVLLSGILFTVGGFWDEVWHRRFGGFGDDFLWPPHQLVYGGIAFIALVAGGALTGVLCERGGLRQRFRNESLIGFLGLIASYLIASLPSDQLWHALYGRDITPWSLPHMIIGSGISTILLIATALQLSLIRPLQWHGPYGLSWQELLILLLMGLATINLLQLAVVEWEGIRQIPQQIKDPFQQTFWGRPEWLYPVLIIAIALFCGNVALYTTRLVGAATLVALFVISFRIIGLAATNGWMPEIGMRFISQIILLPPMVALDLWYAFRLRQIETRAILIAGNLFAGVIGLSFGLPIIRHTLIYPRVNDITLPTMIGIGLITALLAGGLGKQVGVWIVGLSRSAIDAEQQ